MQTYKLWIVEEDKEGKLYRQIPVFAFTAEDAVAKARAIFNVEMPARVPVEFKVIG